MDLDSLKQNAKNTNGTEPETARLVYVKERDKRMKMVVADNMAEEMGMGRVDETSDEKLREKVNEKVVDMYPNGDVLRWLNIKHQG